MSKFLLKTMLIVSAIGLGHTSSYEIKSILNIYPGNSMEFSKNPAYIIFSEVNVTGNDELMANLTSKKPVFVRGPDGELNVTGNADVNFDDTFTCNAGYIKISLSNTKVPNIIVRGALYYVGEVNSDSDEGTKISVLKKEDEPHALFDISALTGGTCKTVVNGNYETFLDYYGNHETNADCPSSLEGLSTFAFQGTTKTNFVKSLREKIQGFCDNASYPVLKNMKIQDYLVKPITSGGISVSTSKEVSFLLDSFSTLIGSDDYTKSCVENKTGLSLVGVDGTGKFDFYNEFNVKTFGNNNRVANTNGNKFVLWPDSYQLPLSNDESENTDFELKTDLVPQAANEHDIFLTSGPKDVSTIRFSGDNRNFNKKVILNGKLKNIEFVSSNGFVDIDATNVDDNISITMPNSADQLSGVSNEIKSIPTVRPDQTISLSIGNNNVATFISTDNSDKNYTFDSIDLGRNSTINIGDANHQGVTLTI